jgi:hypothetical protein
MTIIDSAEVSPSTASEDSAFAAVPECPEIKEQKRLKRVTLSL